MSRKPYEAPELRPASAEEWERAAPRAPGSVARVTPYAGRSFPEPFTFEHGGNRYNAATDGQSFAIVRTRGLGAGLGPIPASIHEAAIAMVQHASAPIARSVTTSSLLAWIGTPPEPCAACGRSSRPLRHLGPGELGPACADCIGGLVGASRPGELCGVTFDRRRLWHFADLFGDEPRLRAHPIGRVAARPSLILSIPAELEAPAALLCVAPYSTGGGEVAEPFDGPRWGRS